MRASRRRPMFPPRKRSWTERLVGTVNLLDPRGDTLARTQAWADARAGRAFTLDGDEVGEGLTRKILRLVGIG